MTRIACGVCLVLLAVSIAQRADATEISGSITGEGRYFFTALEEKEREQYGASLALNAEMYNGFGKNSSIIISPFFRLDSQDQKRSHADLREMKFVYLANSWEVELGVAKVFWGATEFIHLVDIINQTDLVEDISGEEKLGQPMAHFSMLRDWGFIEGFILPFFREQTYPGEHGRPKLRGITDMGSPQYESSAEQYHTDFALRYSSTLGKCDLGIAHFTGTGREPSFIEATNVSGHKTYVPFYPQIYQTSIDLQLVSGEWLWKGESFYRRGQGKSFMAATFGFEYTFTAVFDSSMDIGLIGEYIFDDREIYTNNPYDNDIMLGLRWAANDSEGTEILVGLSRDLNYSSLIMSLEGSRRINNSMKLRVGGFVFRGFKENEPSAFLNTEGYVQVEIITYF